MSKRKSFLMKVAAAAMAAVLMVSLMPVAVFANVFISTGGAVNITPTGATITSTFDVNIHGAHLHEVGILLSTNQNEIVNGQGERRTATLPGSLSGVFTVTLTGLTPNTEYFVRAYVEHRPTTLGTPERTLDPTFRTFRTEQQGAGQTGVVTSSATFANAVISARGSFPTTFANVTERGFVVSSTVSTPTTQNAVRRPHQPSLETAAHNLAADWQVTTTASAYYVRAYIISNGQPFYGSVIRVPMTAETPVVFTRSAEMISSSEARVVIDVTHSGQTAVFERGVVFSRTAQLPQLGASGVQSRTVSGTVGETEVILTGLTPNTRYYVRAYARNQQGTAFGQVIQLMTISADAVRTNAATNISQDRFTANGSITGINAADIREKGFVFSTTNNTPTLSDQRVSTTSISTGYFSLEVTGRARDTRHFVRAYATLESGTIFGQVVEVTTAAQDIAVTVTFQSLALQSVGTQTISVAQGSSITAAQLDVPEGYTLVVADWSVTITDQTTVLVIVRSDAPPPPEVRPEEAFIGGTGNFSFSPARAATRGEVAQILYNLSPDRLIANPIAFTDVAATHPHRRAIDYVSSKLHMRGDAGATTFRPNDSITRAEICVVLMNFYSLSGNATSNFPDVNAEDWFYRPVSLAFQHQMVAGYEDGTFRPRYNITRAEITTIFVRAEVAAGRRSGQPLGTTQFVDVPATHWAHQFVMNAAIPH